MDDEPSVMPELPPRRSKQSSGDLWNLTQTATAVIAGLVGYVYLLGQLVTRVRLAVAHVPVDAALATTDTKSFFGTGLQALALMVAAFAVTLGAAYALTAVSWSARKDEWRTFFHCGFGHRRQASTRASEDSCLPPSLSVDEERLLRLASGFNILVLAAVAGLWAAVLALGPTSPARAPAFWAGFLLAGAAFAVLGPLRWPRFFYVAAVILVVSTALLSVAPIGLFLVVGAAMALLGWSVARQSPQLGLVAFLRSWRVLVVLAIYTLVPVASVAIPPVAFPHAVVSTPSGEQTGGYLTRTGQGISLVVCTPLADATSASEHVVFVESKDIMGTTLRGGDYNLDNGDRPSLATLVLSGLGFRAHTPAIFTPYSSSPRESTCSTGSNPAQRSIARQMPGLGAGVLVGPAPPYGQAHDGELPIQQTSPGDMARLARLYQPTVEVTIADRFWPVSVGAALADRNGAGQTTCLIRRMTAPICPPSLSDLSSYVASASDYVRFPAVRRADPDPQFRAFELGQGITVGPLHQWLTQPASLDPWYTAQVYFYFAGLLPPSAWRGLALASPVDRSFLALEYWFFYPYNYYPILVNSALMNDAPIAGDVSNVDLHQGDWEHVTVLLDPVSLTPQYLYMARHTREGVFIPWTSPSMGFDHGHPIVQAAFGGHSTYDNACGRRARTLPSRSDWVVCGSGRFAFRASTTPLVDISRTTWGCWPGHFGDASVGTVSGSSGEEYVYVSGPVSPLRQAENAESCKEAPQTPELRWMRILRRARQKR